MPSFHLFRKTAKYLGVGFVIGGVGTAGIVLPPKENLPNGLLPQRVLFEGIGRIGRCIYTGAQIYADYRFSLRDAVSKQSQEAWDAVHARCARRLVTLAETNGGLYVKAGQIFSNMSHVLPYPYCSIMAVLQDQIAPRPYSEIKAVLEADFQQPLEEVFSSIDPSPIAAASLAQVHHGILRKENIDVAVKVQYIDIAQRFWGDMRTIDIMLRVAGYFYPGFDFGLIVNKLYDTVGAELDFRLEMRNSERADQELRKGGFGEHVICARMLSDYCTRRVLVSEFVHNSVRISDLRGMEAQGIDVKKAATNFFDAIAYQIFRSGFFHADPHAGNVLVHKLPNGAPQVVLLDFGLCAELDAVHRKALSDIWTSSVTHDSTSLMTLAQRYHCDDYALFASCFLQHPYSYYSLGMSTRPSAKARESIQNMLRYKMNEVNDIVARLPKEYALVLRSIMATRAINHELGGVVNRPMRMLRYSLRTSHENTSSLRLYYLLIKAWLMECYSSWMPLLISFWHPELTQAMQNSFTIMD